MSHKNIILSAFDIGSYFEGWKPTSFNIHFLNVSVATENAVFVGSLLELDYDTDTNFSFDILYFQALKHWWENRDA
jgi:hypothetical protein